MFKVLLFALAWVNASMAAAAGTKRDVRGVELGMKLDQAQVVLEREGATCRKWVTSRDCRFKDGSKIVLMHNTKHRHIVTGIDYYFDPARSADAIQMFAAKTVRDYGLKPGSSPNYWQMPDGSRLFIAPLGDAMNITNRELLTKAERGDFMDAGDSPKH